MKFSASYYYKFLMNKRAFRIYFSVFVLLSYALTQNCIPRLQSSLSNNNIEQLETGHIEMRPSNPPDRYNQYNVTFKQTGFNRDRLNIGLSIIYIENYYDNIGIDFVIRPSRIELTYFIALLTINVNIQWRKVHIHYVASSREEFRCSFFMVDDRSLLQSNTRVKSIKVPKLVQSRALLNVYAGISGIKIMQTSFNLKLGNARVSGRESIIQIPITVSNNTRPFQLLYISYFVYINTGRIIVQSLASQATNTLFIQNVINKKNEQYGFGGMSGVSSSALNNLLKLNNPKKRLLVAQNMLMIWVNAFNVQPYGIVKGKQTIGGLVALAAQKLTEDARKQLSKLKCLTYNECTSQNGIIKQLKSGNLSCVVCSANKIYDEINQKCICADGYFSFNNEQCVNVKQFCGANANYENGSCTQQIVRTINVCQLRQNYVYDASAQKCICKEGFFSIKDRINAIRCSKCPQNTAYNIQNQTCDCAEGFIANGDSCTKCNVAERWNNNTKTCECVSNANRNSNNRCVICSINARFNIDKKDCQCLPGFRGNGIICRIIFGTSGSITIINTSK